MPQNWIQTNEMEDVAGSIRHALRAAEFVHEDQHSWKWVALALHSALQGACVCHLITSAQPIGAVTGRNAREWLAYFEQQRVNSEVKAPKTQLMGLPNLLKAVRRPHSAGDRSNAAGIAISDHELEWLCRFHGNVRNQFIHFEPMSWSIEVSGIPEIAALIARIIEEMLEVGYAFRHLKRTQREEMQQNLQILASKNNAPLTIKQPARS